MTDYNNLSDLYHFAKKNPVKQYSEAYTFFKILGNIRDKSVLDLACGDGYYSRQLKIHGASHVVGVDIAEKMIARAKKIETEKPYGIDYRVFDVCQSRYIGQFDIITSVYLFPYARMPKKLAQMCNTMVINLRPGGKMVSVTLSPFSARAYIDSQIHYGVEMKPQSNLKDGAVIQITITTPQGIIGFENTFWSRQTYEQILFKAGFKSIVWHKPQVSETGIHKYGNTYWQNHIATPGFSVLACYL
jgi:SAM-dependent methyltransferase